eukprot:COSAG01_NODE_5684_length_4102_cov_2.406695_2_plen_138_part_00
MHAQERLTAAAAAAAAAAATAAVWVLVVLVTAATAAASTVVRGVTSPGSGVNSHRRPRATTKGGERREEGASSGCGARVLQRPHTPGQRRSDGAGGAVRTLAPCGGCAANAHTGQQEGEAPESTGVQSSGQWLAQNG